MRVHEIIEAHQWQRFTGTGSSRVWFNSKTGEAVTAGDDGNHSVAVSNNPGLFGVSPDQLTQNGLPPGQKAYDYDGRVLLPVMQQGWVRIFIDPRAPDLNSNAEGVNLDVLRRALAWYCDNVGTPQRFVLVVRHGIGDREGTPYPLKDMEEIEFFLRHGRINQRAGIKDQPVQARVMNSTPHMFKKITDESILEAGMGHIVQKSQRGPYIVMSAWRGGFNRAQNRHRNAELRQRLYQEYGLGSIDQRGFWPEEQDNTGNVTATGHEDSIFVPMQQSTSRINDVANFIELAKRLMIDYDQDAVIVNNGQATNILRNPTRRGFEAPGQDRIGNSIQVLGRKSNVGDAPAWSEKGNYKYLMGER